ncbi:MAG: RNA polymerase sigma factor [Nocardioides sp.]
MTIAGEQGVPRETPHGADAPRPDVVWQTAAEGFRRWVEDDDQTGLDELVRCLTPTLWQIARSCGTTREQAEDVVQLAWLALARSRTSVRDPQAVGSWLVSTTRRDAWRLRRDDHQVVIDDEELADRVGAVPSVEAAVVEADESRRLWGAVDELDDRCRTLLRIVAFEHRPDYAAIAADLDMPVGSIGPTRGRCLTKLKGLLTGGNHRD